MTDDFLHAIALNASILANHQKNPADPFNPDDLADINQLSAKRAKVSTADYTEAQYLLTIKQLECEKRKILSENTRLNGIVQRIRQEHSVTFRKEYDNFMVQRKNHEAAMKHLTGRFDKQKIELEHANIFIKQLQSRILELLPDPQQKEIQKQRWGITSTLTPLEQQQIEEQKQQQQRYEEQKLQQQSKQQSQPPQQHPQPQSQTVVKLSPMQQQMRSRQQEIVQIVNTQEKLRVQNQNIYHHLECDPPKQLPNQRAHVLHLTAEAHQNYAANKDRILQHYINNRFIQGRLSPYSFRTAPGLKTVPEEIPEEPDCSAETYLWNVVSRHASIMIFGNPDKSNLNVISPDVYELIKATSVKNGDIEYTTEEKLEIIKKNGLKWNKHYGTVQIANSPDYLLSRPFGKPELNTKCLSCDVLLNNLNASHLYAKICNDCDIKTQARFIITSEKLHHYMMKNVEELKTTRKQIDDIVGNSNTPNGVKQFMELLRMSVDYMVFSPIGLLIASIESQRREQQRINRELKFIFDAIAKGEASPTKIKDIIMRIPFEWNINSTNGVEQFWKSMFPILFKEMSIVHPQTRTDQPSIVVKIHQQDESPPLLPAESPAASPAESPTFPTAPTFPAAVSSSTALPLDDMQK